MSFHFGMDRLKSGDPIVGYGSDGRVTEVISDPFWQQQQQQQLSGWQRWLQPSGYERRYEWRNGEGPYGTLERDDVFVERKEREGLVSEDRLVYNEKPRYWFAFIILGILMIVLGIVNLLFCLDYHWFSRFYTGVLILIVGIIGLVHGGDYRTNSGKFKSWIYIIVGFIAAILLFLCLGLVVATFAHQSIDITQFGTSRYIEITKLRILINQESVIQNVSSWDTHIWMCYTFDGVTILMLLFGFLVLASVVVVFDNYYNNNYIYIRQVEPFCEPMLFNPYGQVILGQVLIFIGFIVSNTVYGNFVIEWQTLMPLVWTGIIAVFAGIFSAYALKKVHKGSAGRALIAGFIQIVTAIACIACLILLTYGLYENVMTFTENNTMNVTDYSVELLSASVLMFAIGDCLALLALFWAIAALVMLFRQSCRRFTERDMIIDHRAPEVGYPIKSHSTVELLRDSDPITRDYKY